MKPALLLLLLTTLLGCDEGANSGPVAPPSRVVAVQANASAERSLAELCDSLPDESAAPHFELPSLVGEATSSGGGWRWVNIWATWCAPCVGELPMLAEWESRLEADGHPVEFIFVSSDITAEAVDRFREAHPEAPPTERMTDAASLPTWASSLGLEDGAALPLHALVDPEGRVRCARAGAVGEDDYELTLRLLREFSSPR